MKRCLNCMEVHESIYEVCPYCGFVEESYAGDPIDLKPGTRVAGRYIIGTKIGQGGFSITYTGWDTVLHTKVAIKEYYLHGNVERNMNAASLEPVNDDCKVTFDSGLDKFINEARIMAQFNNEAEIVHVYDFLKENNTAYIIMEFIDGQTLRSYVDEYGSEGIGQDEALEIVINIAMSLSKLHNAGVIHQDVSLDNIMITNDKQIKILDFGASKDDAVDISDDADTVVKHSYAPLEQYDSNSKCDQRTDIYALGAVMYHMMTGQAPASAIDRRINDTLRKPKDVNKDIPEWMNDVILKCMEMSPEDRFRDTSHVIRAIEKKESIKKKKSSGRTKIIILAIFICIMGVICFNSFNSNGDYSEVGDNDDDSVKLIDSTFSCNQWEDGMWVLTPTLLVENTSEEKILTNVYVEIDGKNAEGESIYNESYPIATFVAPGTQNVVIENQEVPGEITSVDYKLVDGKHSFASLESLNHSSFIPLEGRLVSASDPLYVEIENNNEYYLEFVNVCVLCRDEKGDLVSGDFYSTERIPAKSKDIYEVYFNTGYDNEIYIVPSVDEMM